MSNAQPTGEVRLSDASSVAGVEDDNVRETAIPSEDSEPSRNSSLTPYPPHPLSPAPCHPLTARPRETPIGHSHANEPPHAVPALSDDVRTFFHDLREDAKGLANVNNAALLGLSLGAAIGVRQDLDDRVRANTARHPDRWGRLSRSLGVAGELQYQFAGLAALYGYARHQQDRELLQLSRTLFSAYTITGLSTVAIKAISDTDRPSRDWVGGKWLGDGYGFPSGHASSSFAIAAVLDDYYGGEVGLPAYALAGLISWSRIDERDHDLSDVLFGAALGYVVGKSVAGRHLSGDGRVRILPWVHPGDGSSGLLIDWRY